MVGVSEKQHPWESETTLFGLENSYRDGEQVGGWGEREAGGRPGAAHGAEDLVPIAFSGGVWQKWHCGWRGAAWVPAQQLRPPAKLLHLLLVSCHAASLLCPKTLLCPTPSSPW